MRSSSMCIVRQVRSSPHSSEGACAYRVAFTPAASRTDSSQTLKEIVEAVSVLARVCSDDMLASALNRSGLLTGRGNRWMRERLISLRSHREIPAYGIDRRESKGRPAAIETSQYQSLNRGT